MRFEERHLSDDELLAAADGELSSGRTAQVEAHLAACWRCRTRKRTLDSAIAELVDLHQQTLDPHLPPAAGARALLQAQLAGLAAQHQPSPFWQRLMMPAAAVLAALLVMTVAYRTRPHPYVVPVSVPKVSLTPGAARFLDRAQVCMAGHTKNRSVPVSLQRKVFEEYGISGADPRAYEVDYLITPELGGLDDIQNLWPQSESATVWNAQVKDALEDRLHELICEGKLDLATAQRDLAANWIDAYKKYFHTDAPPAVRQ